MGLSDGSSKAYVGFITWLYIILELIILSLATTFQTECQKITKSEKMMTNIPGLYSAVTKQTSGEYT